MTAAPNEHARKARARTELAAAGVLFGLMAVAARIASRGTTGFSAGQLSLVRFAIGVAAMIALFRMQPGIFRPVNLRLLVTRGLLGGLAVVLYFFALERIPAGEATLLNNTFPVFATVLAIVLLGERSTVHLWTALILTTLGVFLVLGGGSVELGLGWGEVAGIASAVLGGGAITSIRALRLTDNAPTIFFAFCVGGVVVSIPFAFEPWMAEPVAWAAAVATGLLAVGAQILMTDAFGALTVPEAAVWNQLTPLASYAWAAVLLGEGVSALGAVGVLLVVFGVVWGGVFGHRPPGGRLDTRVGPAGTALPPAANGSSPPRQSRRGGRGAGGSV